MQKLSQTNYFIIGSDMAISLYIPIISPPAEPKTCSERAILEDNRSGTMMMVGMYIPQCKDDGSYHVSYVTYYIRTYVRTLWEIFKILV